MKPQFYPCLTDCISAVCRTRSRDKTACDWNSPKNLVIWHLISVWPRGNFYPKSHGKLGGKKKTDLFYSLLFAIRNEMPSLIGDSDTCEMKLTLNSSYKIDKRNRQIRAVEDEIVKFSQRDIWNRNENLKINSKMTVAQLVNQRNTEDGYKPATGGSNSINSKHFLLHGLHRCDRSYHC